jgi:alpha/beta superfamily hydrolase
MNAEWLHETPAYFGPREALFGIVALPPYPASTGVVLCPPLGQEMVRSHRLYRQIAHMLARQGLAVMRFDYAGTGDSLGDGYSVTLAGCAADVQVAADALREQSRCRRMLALGMRTGGSIALLAHQARPFDALMLCDPVLDGAGHVAALDAMHATMLADTRRFLRPRDPRDGAGQWLGFPHGPELRDALAALALTLPDSPPTLLLRSPDRPSGSGADAGGVELAEALGWDELPRLELAIQSHELIARLQDHLASLR